MDADVSVTFRLFDSLRRSVEPFEPLAAGRVRVYACGPTVYDYAHIGNFRFNVWVDLLRRSLEWAGFDVELVMNITDVDDKTIARSLETGASLQDYTARYTEAFFGDLETLRVIPAAHYPRATDHIAEMVTLIERLIERGMAYEQDGSVYFRVSAFPEYGKLSGLDATRLRSTGRVQGDAYDKEDVRDFALWKAAKEGEPSWDAPFGAGRPGWHIECSAMSMKYLGTTFDIHVGGVDLMFPHHENEIAQSVGATGEPFARNWMHCDHLIVDGAKMSKSLGNQYTLRELIDAGHDPVAIRYLLASVHYRKKLNFTFEALAQAKAAVTRWRETVQRLEAWAESAAERRQVEEGVAMERPAEKATDRNTVGASEAGDGGTGAGAGGTGARGLERKGAAALEEEARGFTAALADDLNTSGALGHVFSLVKRVNAALDQGSMTVADAEAILEWFRDVDRIWGVLQSEDDVLEREVEVDGVRLLASGPPVAEDVVEMVVARMRARAGRDFATADELRDRLLENGVTVEDTPDGARWRTDPA